MKLATMPAKGPDGRLVVVSRDLSRMADASPVAPTLQAALDAWDEVESRLAELFDALEARQVAAAEPFPMEKALAPLPRAWQWLDGSVYESHGALMSKVFGHDDPPRDKPLMYQGLSHQFYPPFADVPFLSEADGIDFEGEFAVITDTVPMGTDPEEAAGRIRLIGQVNDWSLRSIAPIELKTGFGWIQAKPPCSMAPVVATPDELGTCWRDGKVALRLRVEWNGQLFGEPLGEAMSFSFPQLLAHAAATRPLCAGTIIGSGTVSNANFREVGSTCIAERRGIEIVDSGKPATDYMRFGDHVRMEALDESGKSVFGSINQRVTGSS